MNKVNKLNSFTFCSINSKIGENTPNINAALIQV